MYTNTWLLNYGDICPLYDERRMIVTPDNKKKRETYDRLIATENQITKCQVPTIRDKDGSVVSAM